MYYPWIILHLNIVLAKQHLCKRGRWPAQVGHEDLSGTLMATPHSWLPELSNLATTKKF